jgi:hypothetical protein
MVILFPASPVYVSERVSRRQGISILFAFTQIYFNAKGA